MQSSGWASNLSWLLTLKGFSSEPRRGFLMMRKPVQVQDGEKDEEEGELRCNAVAMHRSEKRSSNPPGKKLYIAAASLTRATFSSPAAVFYSEFCKLAFHSTVWVPQVCRTNALHSPSFQFDARECGA